MATVKSLDTDIAVIKNEVSQFGQLLNKLETALDKIADVSNNIGQILAVHEQRLKDGEVHFEELRKDMGEAEDKFDDEVKERWRWILLGIVLAGGVILGNGLNLGSVLL